MSGADSPKARFSETLRNADASLEDSEQYIAAYIYNGEKEQHPAEHLYRQSSFSLRCDVITSSQVISFVNLN